MTIHFDMSYYTFKHSTNSKEIGNVTWGQIELINPYDAKDLLKNNKTLSISCRQYKKALLTDLLSCFDLGINNNYVVSQNLRSLFEAFNMQPHFFSNCSIEKSNGDLVKYYVLHLVDTPFPKMVDFEGSVFRVADTCTLPLTGEEPIIPVKNYTEYINKKNELFHDGLEIRLDRFTINREYIDKYDIFSFFPEDSNLYVSERLKDELLDHEISGIELTWIKDV